MRTNTDSLTPWYGSFTKQCRHFLLFVGIISCFLIIISCAPKRNPEWSDAAKRGDNATARSLILTTNDLKSADMYGETPLFWAAKTGDLSLVTTLVTLGADVNEVNQITGETPIIAAAKNGNVDMIDLLIKNGAKVEAKDRLGNNIIAAAVSSGKSQVFSNLLKAGFSIDPNTASSLLVSAANAGDFWTVKQLLQLGASVNYQGAYGESALMAATKSGKAEIVSTLIEHGAKVNLADAAGRTALHMAAQTGSREICKTLISAGSDINARNARGNTSLMFASFADKLDILEELLSAGARVNDINDAGYSALLFAAGVDGINPAIVNLLVEKGADVNQTARDGLTPVKASCQAGHADLVVYLYENGANPKFDDSTAAGMELNGKIHHILGDYFLAQDKYDKARASYRTSQDYYRKVVNKCSGDLTGLAWERVAVIALQSMAVAALEYTTSKLANQQAAMQSRQLAQLSGMKYAEKTNTGIKGYYAYMTKYNQTYVPTYQGVNMTFRQPPLGSADIDTRKAYVEAKAKQFEDLSTLIGSVLECFDKNASGGAVLHTCVNTVSNTYSATGRK